MNKIWHAVTGTISMYQFGMLKQNAVSNTYNYNSSKVLLEIRLPM